MWHVAVAMVRNFMQLMIANEEKEKNLARSSADSRASSSTDDEGRASESGFLSRILSGGSMRNLRTQKSAKSFEVEDGTLPNDTASTEDLPSEAVAPPNEKQKRQIRHVTHGVAHRDESTRSMQNVEGSGAQGGQNTPQELNTGLDRSSAGRAPDFAGMFTTKKLAAVRKEGRASIIPKRSSLLPPGSTADVQRSSQDGALTAKGSAPRARFISSAKNPTRDVRRTISTRWNRGLNSYLRLLGWTSLEERGKSPPVGQVLDFLQRKYRGVDDAADPSASDPSPEEIEKLETWATSTLGQPVGSSLDEYTLADLAEIVISKGRGEKAEEQTKPALSMREKFQFRKQKFLADRRRHKNVKQRKQQDSVEKALLGGGTYTELFIWLQTHRQDKDMGETRCALLDPVMARVVANGQFTVKLREEWAWLTTASLKGYYKHHGIQGQVHIDLINRIFILF
jgi:hypothetical protein